MILEIIVISPESNPLNASTHSFIPPAILPRNNTWSKAWTKILVKRHNIVNTLSLAERIE